MKDLLGWLCHDFKITPEPNVFSILFCTVVITSFRMGILGLAVYVVVRAARMAW